MTTMFAPTFQKSKLATTLLLCTSLAMTQALIGCTRNDDKKATKKTDTTQNDTKNTPLDCNSSATMTGIQQYVTKQIAQQANSTVQQLGQQAGINVANVSMESMLAQLMVNVQNVKAVSGQADQCQGKVSVTLPVNDIANANQMATSLNQPTLAQRLSAKGLTLENNTVIADTATFKLPTNGGSYQVNSPSADAIISEVSNVLASSQLKQMMIQNAPTANSNLNSTSSSSAPTVSAGAIATGAVVAGATGTALHHVKKHTTSHATSAHHATPKKVEPKKAEPKEKSTEDSPKTPTHKATSETASSKTVTTKTSTSTEKTSTPSPTTKVNTTKTTEKTVIKPQAVPNDSTKLTIEQRNEKY